MAALSTWLDEALPECPGASLEGIRQVARRVFREFCVESGAFILEQEIPMDIVQDQQFYDVRLAFPTLMTGNYVEPIYIWSVGYFPDYATDPNHVRFLSSLQAPKYRNRATLPNEQPWGYKTFIDRPGIFEMTPPVTQNISQALSCYVAFRLSRTVDWDDNIPDVFEFNWFDIILDGIIGYMCAQQDKPYTDARKADLHQRRFILGRARAREMARRQFNSGDDTFAFPRETGWISS